MSDIDWAPVMKDLRDRILEIRFKSFLSDDWKENLANLLTKWHMFLKEDELHYVYCFVDNQKKAIEEIKKAGVEAFPLFLASVYMYINAKQCKKIIDVLTGKVKEKPKTFEISSNMRRFLKKEISVSFDKTNPRNKELHDRFLKDIENLSSCGINILWKDNTIPTSMKFSEYNQICFAITFDYDESARNKISFNSLPFYDGKSTKLISCEDFYRESSSSPLIIGLDLNKFERR